MAFAEDKAPLFNGRPTYLGYIASAFKVNTGRNASNPHADWEKKIAPRVRDRVIKDLEAVDPALVTQAEGTRLVVLNFHRLAPEAQKFGLAIGPLRGRVNSGHYSQVDEAAQQFTQIAKEIVKHTKI